MKKGPYPLQTLTKANPSETRGMATPSAVAALFAPQVTQQRALEFGVWDPGCCN